MNNSKTIQTDVLVAGAGIAGIKAAYTAAKSGCNVLVVTKSYVAASDYVLGFNAVLSEEDSVKLYAEDTMSGGGNINNPQLVKTLAENSAKEVESVELTGLKFDKEDGNYHLLKPLGCTEPRLAHIKNLTGKITLEKFREMADEAGVKILYKAMLADIITESGKVVGATVFDLENKEVINISAKAIVIATGGIHIATDSTYPMTMTGDGYGTAYRAGAELTDMEFIQYEPCRCIYPQKLGISTTLLAKGGKITNNKGERFLLRHYNTEGDAPKDALAKLIYAEIINGNGSEHGGVYLDLTDVPTDEIIEKHSLYYNRFMNAGIDITKEIIEVGPCAHSFMGGIVIDKSCRTCVGGLFAAGEASGGIHGANRVGGNAGTEIYVFGTIAGNSAAEYAKNNSFGIFENVDISFDQNGCDKEYFENQKKKLQTIMAKYMGPVRDGQKLAEAMKMIEDLKNEVDNSSAIDFDAAVSKKECENMLVVCKCSSKAAINRKESRGVHTRADYPETKKDFETNFVQKRG